MASLLDNDREMFRLLTETAETESNTELRKIAKRAMKKVIEEELTTRQKQFIVLYYYKQMDMPTIAKECGVNISTVSRTLNRARQNIFRYIKFYFNK